MRTGLGQVRVVEGSARSLGVLAKSWLSHQAGDTCPGHAPVPLFQGRPRTQNKHIQGTPSSWALQETSGWTASTLLCKTRNWKVASGAAREGPPPAESLFPGPRFFSSCLAEPPEHHPLCRRVLGSPAPTRSPSPRLGAAHFQPELSLNKHRKTTHVKTIDAGPSADPERGPRPQPAWLGASAQ